MDPPPSPMGADLFPQNSKGRTQAPVPIAFAAAEILYKDNSHKLQSNPTARAECQSRYLHPYHSHTRQQPCFQQTSGQQSNISLRFRQSEFKKKKKRHAIKKKISFLQHSLEKTFMFLLAQIHSACSTSSGIHGPRRAEKSKGMCKTFSNPTIRKGLLTHAHRAPHSQLSDRRPAAP